MTATPPDILAELETIHASHLFGVNPPPINGSQVRRAAREINALRIENEALRHEIRAIREAHRERP